jgi:predicted short-subunit dehydrogenase-like oxidoreductase (DUF2520 family)
MKSSKLIILSLAVLLVVSSAFAATAAKHPAMHGKSVHGTISKLNDSGKTFDITSASKKTYDIQWNDATKVSGGTLKDGESATVKYMVHDGKNVATSIMITKKG